MKSGIRVQLGGWAHKVHSMACVICIMSKVCVGFLRT